MKRGIGIVAVCALFLLAAVPAQASWWYMMDFSNTTLDLGPSSQIDISNQYDAFGFNGDHIYRYIDTRDVYDDFGISNGWISENSTPSTTGWVYFNTPTDSVELEWNNLSSNTIYVDAYAADNTWLGGFSGGGSGIDKIVANDISYFTFHDTGGQVGISTMFYDSTIPEPSTLILFGLGTLGLAAYRRRRDKK